MPDSRPRSSAGLLALAYAVLVLYASLYPFEGWTWPPGQSFATLLVLPHAVQDRFDLVSNLLGYMPLGLLTAVVLRRPGRGVMPTLLACVLPIAALSYGCEVLQQFLPRRVPALGDFAMNTSGAFAGALLGLALHGLGLVQRWRRWHATWFTGSGAVALALLALWPLGLLFPQPVPLGLGQVGTRLRDWLASLLQDVPWARGAWEMLSAATPGPSPLSPLAEMLIVAAGLLGPCMVAFAVMTPGWRRLVMAAGALALGVLGMTVSTWLNFGPTHAWAWLTPVALPGLVLGAALSVVLVPLPRRLAPGLGLVVLTALVVGVAQAPADPYFSQSLQAWEQGRFVHFHGLAQWIGWLWPYATMAWMLTRLGLREPA